MMTTTTTSTVETPLTPAAAARRTSLRRHRIAVHLTQAAVLVVVIGGWQLWVAGDPRKIILYGEPSGILNRLYTWTTVGTAVGSLGSQILVTLEEAVIGFLIGTALGIVSGLALGRVRFLAEVFGPFIKVLNSIPRIVLGSVFVLAFGLGLESKVLLVIVLVFFGVFFNAFQGAREVDRNLVNNARILGASRTQVLTSIVVPSATSWIFASLHAAFGFALIGAVVGEYAGADKGLGLLIANAQGTFDAAGIYAGMIITTVIALLAEYLLTLLENRLLRWRPPVQNEVQM
jgi:NitT/TauT family transport system permease protein